MKSKNLNVIPLNKAYKTDNSRHHLNEKYLVNMKINDHIPRPGGINAHDSNTGEGMTAMNTKAIDILFNDPINRLISAETLIEIRNEVLYT